jgi:hypothetical protein
MSNSCLKVDKFDPRGQFKRRDHLRPVRQAGSVHRFAEVAGLTARSAETRRLLLFCYPCHWRDFRTAA